MFVAGFMVMYIILNIFISIDLYLWIKSFRNPFRWKRAKVIFVTLYTALTSLIFISFFLPNDSEVKMIFSRITNYYLGFLINMLMVIIGSHIVAAVLKLCKLIPNDFFKGGKTKFLAGWICTVIAIAFSLYGFVNANNIEVSTYNISVDKKCENMKIVLVADTHLGYSLGIRNMEEMVDKINSLNADLVCFAGDIFDNNINALDDPEGIKQEFLSIKSRYGVYACWGNHDVTEDLIGGFSVSDGTVKRTEPLMKQFLIDSGMILLEDETIVVDNKFVLIGRRDMSNPGTADNERLSVEEFDIDTSLPVICMDHQPDELSEKANAGIDIDLGGHTHSGQFFPINLVIGLKWDNPHGILEVEGENGNIMYNVVTEGVGVYGPFMRTFTDSEIVEINVDFTK